MDARAIGPALKRHLEWERSLGPWAIGLWIAGVWAIGIGVVVLIDGSIDLGAVALCAFVSIGATMSDRLFLRSRRRP